MARSPSDATRFTSTGPYVSTKPSSSPPSSPGNIFSSNAPPSSSSSSSPPSGGGGGTQISFGRPPPNETPQQKIARLRAAAALAKQPRETTFDKTVRIGRVWADRAHRVTALSLIGLTIISGAVATAGITDMLLHNRRRRNEWLAQKQAESARDLAIATEAQARGTATEDQVLLVNRERAAVEAQVAKQNRPGVYKRVSDWLFADVSREEQKGGKLGAKATAAVTAVESSGKEFVQEGKRVVHAVEDKVEAQRRTGDMVAELLRPAGGPLDRQAQVAVDAASNTTRSWTNWWTGR